MSTETFTFVTWRVRMRISIFRYFAVAAGAALLMSSDSLHIAAAPLTDCAASARVLERFRADLRLDRDVLNRAQEVVEAATRSEASPSPSQLGTVAEDAADDIDQAASQIDAAAQTIAQQLDSAKLGPKVQEWNAAVSRFEAAHSQFRAAIRKENWGRPTVSGQAVRPLATLYLPTGPPSELEAAQTPLLSQIAAGLLGPAAVSVMDHWIFSDTPYKNPPATPPQFRYEPTGDSPVGPPVNVIFANARRIKAHNGILRGLGALQGHNMPEARQQLQASRTQLDGTDRALQPLQSAVDQCMQPQQQTAKSAQSPKPSKPAHRIGPGRAAAIASVPAAGAIGLWIALNHRFCGSPSGDQCGCTSDSCPNNQWSITSYSGLGCSSTAHQCYGTITINIPVGLSRGFSYAQAWMGGGTLIVSQKTSVNATGGTPSALFDFSGWRFSGLGTCQSISTVEIFDGFTNGSPVHVFNNQSIPVLCQ